MMARPRATSSRIEAMLSPTEICGMTALIAPNRLVPGVPGEARGGLAAEARPPAFRPRASSGLLFLEPGGRADLSRIGPVGQGLDPFLRLLDDLELAVVLGLADLRPEIGVGVLGVDLDESLRRLELLAPGRLANLRRRDPLLAELL